MEAVVLAGGLGTRLRSVVSDVPKPMAPVAGRPFLRYVLDALVARGVDRVVLAVGYKRGSIMEAFGNVYRGARLVYSVEERPLLTGGALKKALELCRDDAVFVVNGDTLFDVDLEAMAEFRRAAKAPFVMAVRPVEDAARYGAVCVSPGGRIERFLEKRPEAAGKPALINGGVSLLSRDFLAGEGEGPFSLEKDVLERRVAEGVLHAFVSTGFFVDMGIPRDYARACRELAGRRGPDRAVFFDRDGTINEDTGHLYRPQDMRFLPGMPEFIARWNAWGWLVIVVTNQSGIARGLYTEDDMRALHRVMNDRLKAGGAHIDAFYHCPHHPDITGPCRCRKPGTGMLEKALADFELDPSRCLLFGDSPTDMEAAARCGIFGVEVTTDNKMSGVFLKK